LDSRAASVQARPPWADLFATHGVSVIDTDYIAHQLTVAGGPAIASIREEFGDRFINASGAMDRARMRDCVFSDMSAKARLEAILHPLIRVETERAATQARGPYLLFVVPLLVESGNWRQRVSRVLVVDCPEQLQIDRVMQRSGLSDVQVRAIMATQVSRTARLAAADDVVLNDGETAALAPQVNRLHTLYTELAAA